MKKKLVISLSVIVTVLAVLFLWPSSLYDLSRVHPSIRGLQEPYQSVTADYYLDGGSVGMEIIDRDGQKIQLAIPISDGPGDTGIYHRLYIGARYSKDANAVEVVFTKDTKRFLADVLSRYPAGPESDRDLALIALRGSARDYVGVYGRE